MGFYNQQDFGLVPGAASVLIGVVPSDWRVTTAIGLASNHQRLTDLHWAGLHSKAGYYAFTSSF